MTRHGKVSHPHSYAAAPRPSPDFFPCNKTNYYGRGGVQEDFWFRHLEMDLEKPESASASTAKNKGLKPAQNSCKAGDPVGYSGLVRGAVRE